MALVNQQEILDFLREGEFVTEKQLAEAQKVAQQKQISVTKALVELGLLQDSQLGQLIADFNDWRFIELSKEKIDQNLAKLIPETMARQQEVLVFEQKDASTLKVAMNDPNRRDIIQLISKKTGKNIEAYFATESDLESHFRIYHQDLNQNFSQTLTGLINALGQKDQEGHDQSTIQIIDQILAKAFETKASDIHIEPYETETVIRFRVDGLMQDMATISKEAHELLIARIKVMAHLHTDEHQKPQDGKLKFKYAEEKIDVRVSIVPTTKGENAVMRLLVQHNRNLSLETIGFSESQLEVMRRAIKKPWGMLLVTGPTGSGKTTTLYAVLKILNQRDVNIATIEDPVEYNIDGITQIQVNNKAELTFASGLRSIVRQDPDIVMVGEIRDQETANIAVNSAMTGHSVLSTLHTNDAATAIPRLIDMGVEPFLAGTTINVIIAQRLVRTICKHCRHSYEVTKQKLSEQVLPELLERLTSGRDKITLYKGQGCDYCGNSGFEGRTGIFEVLDVTDNIKKLIDDEADANKIHAQALQDGMQPMIDQGIERVINGETTIEEVIRVINF